jgi:formiminoglutamase
VSPSKFSSHFLSPVRINVSVLREEMLGRQMTIFSQPEELSDIVEGLQDKLVIVGIPDDRGVALNFGHGGASGGPESFRQAFYRLYDTRLNDVEWFGSKWVDLGDVVLADEIAETHARLAEVVHAVLSRGARRVHVVGGGHDFSFGSYSGHLRNCQGVLPIVNFDGHFDLRPVQGGEINSGTPFRRVIENHPQRIADGRALCEIGIQRERNPQSLWDFALAHGVSVAEYCAGRRPWRFWNFANNENRSVEEQLNAWLDHWSSQKDFSGSLHLSLDLDVFHVAAAMGTSASTSFGVPVETLWPCVEDVMSRKMCRVVDVAELCPARDSQMQTARLAAALLLRGALSSEMAVR